VNGAVIMSNTLPEVVKKNSQKWGDRKIALRRKQFGVWKEYTWNDYLRHLKYLSLGLMKLGLVRQDKVIIIGDNSPEWVIAELAVQALGAIPTGAFTDSGPDELAYIIEKADAKVVIARDQEQVDKFMEIRSRCQEVKFVVYWEPKGMRGCDKQFFMSIEDVQQLGQEVEREAPSLFGETVEKGDPDDVALLLFTSGTGGNPKAVVHTYRTLLLVAEGLVKAHRYDDKDEYVSFAPLAWIPEQIYGVILPICAGYTVNYAEKADSVRSDIRDISPSIIAMSPRLWEDLCSLIVSRMAEANLIRRIPYKLFLAIGYRVSDHVFKKMKVPFFLSVIAQMAEVFLYRPLRDNIGLRKIKHAYSGGADLGIDTFRFYKAIGVNIKQLYGLTESGGITTTHRDNDVKFGTMGRPLEGCQVKISDRGEILIKSPSLFRGYYRDDEATAKAFDEDGWLLTGDAGFLDDEGHLICIGRLTDVMELPGGDKVSSVFIEGKLKFSPYIKDVVVFGGEGRPYVTAIVVIDYEIVSNWAEKKGTSFTTYSDLSQKEEVYELIEDEVRSVNRDLPESGKIRRFTNFYKELDPDDAELTRSRKLRRSFFLDRYPQLMDSLYRGEYSVQVDGEIKYQDGRIGKTKTRLQVRKVENDFHG